MSRGVVGTVQGGGRLAQQRRAGTMVMLGGYATACGACRARTCSPAAARPVPEPEDVKAERVKRVRKGAEPDHPDSAIEKGRAADELRRPGLKGAYRAGMRQ